MRVGAQGLTLDGNALIEIKPGLFLTADGETLDFRGREPRWRNIRLYPAGLALWEKVLLGIAVLLFPVVAVAWFLSAAFRRIRRSPQKGMGRGWL